MGHKKLVLITLDETTKERYFKDLRYFFDDYLDIEAYSLKEGINNTIIGDLAIITSPVLTNIAKKHLTHDIKIIYMNRTFAKENVDPLYDLPSGMKALLVSNSNIAAMECISTLYEIGIKQLDLTPVYPGMDNNPEGKIAITPAQIDYIPEQVEKVIDIGWRVLDISTLMDISTKLEIMDKSLEEKIGIYAKKIIPISHGLHFTLNNTNIIKNEMNIVLNVIDDGVIVTDTKHNIIHCNKSITRIFNLEKKHLYGLIAIGEILPKELTEKIIGEEKLENNLIKVIGLNKSFIVTKRPINVYNDMYGYAIIIKDITEFENLENKLRKQLIKQGYVAKYKFKDIAVKSKNMLKVIEKAKKISKIDASTLITGESGTGKELFAQSIHSSSKRKSKPFVAINCASLPSELLESELFGYEEGAFTGAKKGGKKGLFELAHTGTIFLDEIGDMPMDVQVKLLRVLQEKEVMRIGSNSIIPIDVRVIAATNHNLRELIRNKEFRKDLYYRLNVLNLYLPPLRERKVDIPYLIDDILRKISMENKRLDNKLMDVLSNYSWEGNVRELRNCIEYMAYMGGEVLTVEDLPVDIEYEKKGRTYKENQGFPELLDKDKEIAVFILNALKYRSAGRRLLYNQACENGIKTTEYQIRKMMDYLYNKGFITYEVKRKGAILTEKGRKKLLEI